MKDKDHYLVEGSDYLLSLSKMTGKDITDIHGYICYEFGEPVFKISQIAIGGTHNIWVEGEHDIPYILSADDIPGLTEEDMKEIQPKD